MRESEKERYRRDHDLCACGASLGIETHRLMPGGVEEYRVNCTGTNYPERKHFEPGPWAATEEEALQVWKMVRLLTE